MPPRKKRSSKISKAKPVKRKANQTTSRKLSSAAKRRRRVKGRFATGRVYAASDEKSPSRPPKPVESNWGKDMESLADESMSPRRTFTSDKQARSEATQEYVKFRNNMQRKGISSTLAHEYAVDHAINWLRAATDGKVDATPEEIAGEAGVKLSRSEGRGAAQLKISESEWKTAGRGLYDPMAKRAGTGPSKPSGQTLFKMLAKGEQEWLMKDIQGGELAVGLDLTKPRRGDMTEAQRRVFNKYLEGRVLGDRTLGPGGLTHEEAIQYAKADRRGRPSKDFSTPTSKPNKTIAEAQERSNQKSGRGKYESLAKKGKESAIGSEAKGVAVPTEYDLKKMNPDITPREIIDVQTNYREGIAEEVMRNQRWAHENKRSKFMDPGQAAFTGPDRLTVFTTTLGKPEISVPTDSLVGQYIINRRKKVARNVFGVPRSQLRGRFPQAVRDLHIIEAATNRTVGAEGSYGLYKRAGWRAGTKKSRVYGQPMPVGAQMMYNPDGTPMYDSLGRVRFTEGATRDFRWIPSKGLGYGVFAG